MENQWTMGRHYAWDHDGEMVEVVLESLPSRGDFGFRADGDDSTGEFPGPTLSCIVKRMDTGMMAHAPTNELVPMVEVPISCYL